MGFAVSRLGRPATTDNTAAGLANGTPLITRERCGPGCSGTLRWHTIGFTPTALRRCAFSSRWGPRFGATGSVHSARFSTVTRRLPRRDVSRRPGALAKSCALGSSWHANQVQPATAPKGHQREALLRSEGGPYVSYNSIKTLPELGELTRKKL